MDFEKHKGPKIEVNEPDIEGEDFYGILGVSPDASKVEIVAAYNGLVKEYEATNNVADYELLKKARAAVLEKAKPEKVSMSTMADASSLSPSKSDFDKMMEKAKQLHAEKQENQGKDDPQNIT